MFRNRVLKASKKYFEGAIAKHVANVEVMLDNTVEMISNYHDKLEMLNKYFKEA